ncbi:protein phosphatase 2C domain-containing protein [Streptomyces sp. R39]|uniref:Protein phosphatase 2C domain-containing protein n=1 Tax=Streptomyces sp. R39 TaxID=3238631 RepID=A0AB39QZ10_9ACTN
MSQPGGRSARHEDDWWGQLYEDSADDTGPTAVPDSLDDRFASAEKTVGGRRGVTAEPGGDQAPPTVPAQRAPAAPAPKAWPWDEEDQEQPEADDDAPAAAHPATRPDLPAPPPRAAPEAPEAPESLAPWASRAPEAADAVESLAPWASRDPEVSEAADAVESLAPWASRDPEVSEAADAVESLAPWASRDPEVSEATVAPESLAAWAPRTPEAPEAPEAPEVTVAPEPLAPWASRDPEVPEGTVAPESLAARVPRVPQEAPSASSVDYVGSGPPTYDAEPTALPAADPDELDDLVADTVLEGARYGSCTLRAVSQRGDSARYRGEPRRDALLVARFGAGEQALVLVAMATGARAAPGAHRAAAEVCEWIARAVGRSHQRLTEDIQAARRGDLKSGLHRLTDRSLGRLRVGAAERGVAPEEYAASLRCLLVPAHPQCRTRVFFGAGEGGLFRLRDGEWQDIEPRVDTDSAGEPVLGFGSQPAETPAGDRLTMDLGIPTPPSPYEPAPEPPRDPFLFRASVARPGDALVMCTGGLADPLRGEPALCAYLARRWSGRTPPGLAAFLADAQVRVKGYADDRTAAAVWEA